MAVKKKRNPKVSEMTMRDNIAKLPLTVHAHLNEDLAARLKAGHDYSYAEKT